MAPPVATMLQDGGLGATCFFEGVAKHWHAVEPMPLVNVARDFWYRTLIPLKPRRGEIAIREWVEEVAEKVALHSDLSGLEGCQLVPEPRTSQVLRCPQDLSSGQRLSPTNLDNSGCYGDRPMRVDRLFRRLIAQPPKMRVPLSAKVVGGTQFAFRSQPIRKTLGDDNGVLQSRAEQRVPVTVPATAANEQMDLPLPGIRILQKAEHRPTVIACQPLGPVHRVSP
jgi:hypothetical protein